MKLILAILMVLISCTGCAWLMTGNKTVEDAIKLTQAEGGSGCVYLRLTGAYPPFGAGTITIIQANDSTKKQLTFEDCLKALPAGDRQRIMRLE